MEGGREGPEAEEEEGKKGPTTACPVLDLTKDNS